MINSQMAIVLPGVAEQYRTYWFEYLNIRIVEVNFNQAFNIFIHYRHHHCCSISTNSQIDHFQIKSTQQMCIAFNVSQHHTKTQSIQFILNEYVRCIYTLTMSVTPPHMAETVTHLLNLAMMKQILLSIVKHHIPERVIAKTVHAEQ